ncbi:hypothetical protein [Pseudoduganella sp. RAF53_2]|uniref:hypothetical protein n=1 Tax=unclassified Pseudoduganella TaxID=2637179 RepID=UPI003F943DA3
MDTQSEINKGLATLGTKVEHVDNKIDVVRDQLDKKVDTVRDQLDKKIDAVRD